MICIRMAFKLIKSFFSAICKTISLFVMTGIMNIILGWIQAINALYIFQVYKFLIQEVNKIFVLFTTIVLKWFNNQFKGIPNSGQGKLIITVFIGKKETQWLKFLLQEVSRIITSTLKILNFLVFIFLKMINEIISE